MVPSFCGRRQGVAAKPPQVTVSCPLDTRRWTEPVWQLSDHPRHPFGPPLIDDYRGKRWQVAAALSAAVTTTNQQKTAPTLQAEPSQKKRRPPNASRSSGERGLGGEALLSEKRPLPPASPQSHVSSGGGPGEGTSLQRSPLPWSSTPFAITPSRRFLGWRARLGGRRCCC